MNPLHVLVASMLVGTIGSPAAAGDIPYFARKYDVSCSQCHVAPPKLSVEGEAFLARGYVLPQRVPRRTWPLALWLSTRAEALPGVDDAPLYVNRVELISGGPLTPQLSYFMEWRPLSLESRADGTLRDRAGRFEDLFLVATGAGGRVEATVGQFRLINQVDVSRRVGLAEPFVLSTSLPGAGSGTPREVGLRAFSPAGRSPAARLAYQAPLAGGWRWTTAVALPLPGEISVPLTREARIEASNEIDGDPKGVLVESFARRGLLTIGGHVFYDDAQRFLAHALTTGNRGPWYWTLIAGFARQAGVTRGRWSVEAEYLRGAAGGGMRIEDQAADLRRPALHAYLNAHFPGTRYTVRLTLEQRIERDRNTTVLELGTVF